LSPARTYTPIALASHVAQTTGSPPAPPSPAALTTAPSPTLAATEECTNRGAFVEDVTVRDGTPFVPREGFVKIWRVRNAGTCTWTEKYGVQFIGGDQMQAPERIPLASAVRPGTETEIAVDMVAPEIPGTYQGYWKFISDQGTFFGIGAGGNASFWVSIEVVADGPAALTPAATTAFSVAAQGVIALRPLSGVDLDSGLSGPADQDDLRVEPLEGSGRNLAPANGAVLGLVSTESGPATAESCSMALLSGSPVPFTGLSTGDAFCFRTSQGRIGTMTITEVGDPLTAEFVTWAP
jgi:hypothetical protein